MRDDEITAYALAAGRGDPEASAAFVRATQADIWRYVAYLVDRECADDLTQETYLRALRSLPSFRADTAARVWLLSIARRTVVDHFRKQGRRPPVAGSLDADLTLTERIGPASPSRAGEVELHSLLRALGPHQRAAFVLTQITGLSYAEAAAVCGVPIGTIRSRVARAREELMAAMNAESASISASPSERPVRALRRRR